MRFVFFGTPELAVPSLRALVAAGHEAQLAVSQPDRAGGRARAPEPTPVKRAAREMGIATLEPERLADEGFLAALRSAAADLFVVVAYGRILRRGLLDLAPAVNLHFSLLPLYRGAAPVQWTLARGEKVSGVTTMLINERLDEGDVLLKREAAILPGEHAPALRARLAQLGAALLVETVERFAAGTLERRPQDPRAATYAPRLSPADGEVDLRMRAVEIEGRIRGFDPWPGVWARLAGRRVRLVDGRALAAQRDEAPGTVVELSGGLGLVCGEGTVLQLERLQFAGRRPASAVAARNGRQIRPGDVLS